MNVWYIHNLNLHVHGHKNDEEAAGDPHGVYALIDPCFNVDESREGEELLERLGYRLIKIKRVESLIREMDQQ